LRLKRLSLLEEDGDQSRAAMHVLSPASVRSTERLRDVFASELHDAWRDRFAYNNELSDCNG
jgi:hypothetical protein